MLGKILAPVAAKRGFAVADLIAAWPEIVGARYAEHTQVESILWPRYAKDAGGVLTLIVEGGFAIYLQHELAPLIERLNRFLGKESVASIRLVQRPLVRARPRPAEAMPAKVSLASRPAVAAELAGIDDDGLREALRRLGENVFAESGLKVGP